MATIVNVTGGAVRWGLTLLTVAAAIVVVFAFANLGLTAALLAKEHQLPRLGSDARTLVLSGPQLGRGEAERRYRALYEGRLGPNPNLAAIRRYFDRGLAGGGPIVLDQILVDYIVARWGALDGRSIPAGVYVGARAIGPDTPPLSPMTQYLAQYALYARHGYVLVVEAPEAGVDPVEFSASRASDFQPQAPNPHQLMIHSEPFRPGAYDFPSRGQAVHELYRLSDDPKIIHATTPELTALAKALHATGARYELFRQNSNTVLGCMLRASELHRGSIDRLRLDWLVSLRLIGISRPLWSHPAQRPANVRCG